jgi:hypothetical protein
MTSALSTYFKRDPHLLPPTILLDDQTHGNMLLNLVFLQLLIHHVAEYLVCAFLTFDFSRAPSVIIIIPSRVSSLKAFCVISKQLSVVPNPWLPLIASTTRFFLFLHLRQDDTSQKFGRINYNFHVEHVWALCPQ